MMRKIALVMSSTFVTGQLGRWSICTTRAVVVDHAGLYAACDDQARLRFACMVHRARLANVQQEALDGCERNWLVSAAMTDVPGVLRRSSVSRSTSYDVCR